MLFQQELIRQIARRKKTQTRRPVKADHKLMDDGQTVISTRSQRKVYQVGQTYAVCPKRGQPCAWVNRGEEYPPLIAHLKSYNLTGETYWDKAQTDCFNDTGEPDPERWLRLHQFEPLRIKLVNIKQEDVREISTEDALAEGFTSRLDFWNVWTAIYQPRQHKSLIKTQPHQLKDPTWAGVEQWAYDYLCMVDSPNWSAWILKFEVAQEQPNATPAR